MRRQGRLRVRGGNLDLHEASDNVLNERDAETSNGVGARNNEPTLRVGRGDFIDTVSQALRVYLGPRWLRQVTSSIDASLSLTCPCTGTTALCGRMPPWYPSQTVAQGGRCRRSRWWCRSSWCLR